jgi:serine/threonine protein kinase
MVKFLGAGDLNRASHGKSVLIFNVATCGILYEFCPGNDLFSYVANKTTVMNSGLCNIIFAQIMKGVSYMHS